MLDQLFIYLICFPFHTVWPAVHLPERFSLLYCVTSCSFTWAVFPLILCDQLFIYLSCFLSHNAWPAVYLPELFFSFILLNQLFIYLSCFSLSYCVTSCSLSSFSSSTSTSFSWLSVKARSRDSRTLTIRGIRFWTTSWSYFPIIFSNS